MPGYVSYSLFATDTNVFTNIYYPYSNSLTVVVTSRVGAVAAPWQLTAWPDEFTNATAYRTSFTNTVTLTKIPAGTYSATFDAMRGFYIASVPPDTNIDVSATRLAYSTNWYQPYSNTLVVTVAGITTTTNVVWTLSCVNNYLEFTNSVNFGNTFTNTFPGAIPNIKTIASIPTGYYGVTFPPLSGYVLNSPNPQYVNIVTSSPLVNGITGTYVYINLNMTNDTDGNGLPDGWEMKWFKELGNDPNANPDDDWIPSASANIPSLISISNIVQQITFSGNGDPSYPLPSSRLLTHSQMELPLGGPQLGYSKGVKFNNRLECFGLDGYYQTNGPSGTWVPDDDPYTDPTKLDTQAPVDSVIKISDGWRYYFWYWRSSDAYSVGITNGANLGWVNFWRIVPPPDKTNAPTGIVMDEGMVDSDKDGIYDVEEYETTGTDPTHCDTEGDGMDDYWEIFNIATNASPAFTNALNSANGSLNQDGDYYAAVTNPCVLTTGMVGTAFADPVCYSGVDTSPGAVWVDSAGANVFDLYQDIIIKATVTLTNRQNGISYTNQVFYGTTNSGLGPYKQGYPVWVDMNDNSNYDAGVDVAIVNPPLKHDGVYCMPPAIPLPGVCSFDPRTAWTNLADAPNTVPYTTYQEYLGGDYLGRLSWDAGGKAIVQNDSDSIPRSRTSYSNPQSQDTDGDLIPDGWELFVGMNPNSAGDAGVDSDSDGLSNFGEWANTTHSLGFSGAWTNKPWPTDPGFIMAPLPNDPHPADTDWDGVSDGGESSALSNPTQVDTDGDGLPDGWELYAGTSITNSDANLDLDHDGLLNWQEYWTGTVPEWMDCDPAWNVKFLARRFMDWNPPAVAAPTNDPYTTFGTGVADLRWFVPPDFLTCPSFLYANGAITNLDELRTNFPAAESLADYHTTFANVTDSDDDGMDDFWEVFHCLNPLRGYSDRVFGDWDLDKHGSSMIVGSTDADPGTPGYQVGLQGVPFTSVMDLVDYYAGIRELLDPDAQAGMVIAIVGPQNFGLVGMDPDGDGTPNFNEYPYYWQSHLHTSPSPLWRTDPYATGAYSFVARNYTRDNTIALGGFNTLGFEGIEYSASRGSLPFRWAAMTEGFDTDNDIVGDYNEITGNRPGGNTVASTDPLNDESPIKNRVVWLDGTNSWLRSYAWSHYGNFTKFSVEAWVRPSRVSSATDQVIVEKTSAYTVETSGGFTTIPLANFQLGISTNGAPYVLFHDVSGQNMHKALSTYVGQAQVNQWVHLAGVFDGTNLTLYVNGEATATHHTTDVPARGIEGNYPVWHPNCNLSIGARELGPGWMFPVAGANFFAGCIDEVRVWDRVLSMSEIIARKDRRLTPGEVGTVLGGNEPYQEGASNLFAYYRFTELPDPNVDGKAPSGYPADRPPLSMNYSLVYTNYLVIAADRVKRIPRLAPLDTRVIDGIPVATNDAPDAYGIATANYLGIQLPGDFRNSANPYNFTHSRYNIDMGRGMWLCGRAQGLLTNIWLSTLDPNDPDSSDTDGDGLPDWWEQIYGLDPLDATGNNGHWGDPDHDGLNNYAEYLAGTDPLNSDTNGNGIGDYDDPHGVYSRSNGEMYTDGDGMPDDWEVLYGLDPQKYDADLDKDGDGWTNYQEFLAGTNPSDPNSHPQPTVYGTVHYYGTNSGNVFPSIRVWAIPGTNLFEDPRAAQATTCDSAGHFSITGLPQGYFTLFAFMDLTGDGLWTCVQQGQLTTCEPAGQGEANPYFLNSSSITSDIRVGVSDFQPGYGRFLWATLTTNSPLANYALTINRISESGAPTVLQMAKIRPDMSEFYFQRKGIYGLTAGSYQWWATGGATNRTGVFHITWPALLSQPTLLFPRGDAFYNTRGSIAWNMGFYSTQYRLQLALQPSAGTVFFDSYYPVPYRDNDGYYRDYLPIYFNDMANGVYYWRLASRNPYVESPWSEWQTFTLNLSTTNSRWITGDIIYYGKVPATRIIVEAFNNSAFSGQPIARKTLMPPATTNWVKCTYTLLGLEQGNYYVRAYLDTTPALSAGPSGKPEFWSSVGFYRSQNNFYQPGMVNLTDVQFMNSAKIIIHDKDTDNDELPDAWEMVYFGNLDQTGAMDYDDDGETNLEEYIKDGVLQNPANWDTDGDGLADGFESHYIAAAFGFVKSASSIGGALNPNNWDTDGDGYSDGAELLRYHTNPLDPASHPSYLPLCTDAWPSPGDYDGDGRSDPGVYDFNAGVWRLVTMGLQVYNLPFGFTQLLPMVGDYDGDGRSDFAFYEPAAGRWTIYFTQFGQFGSAVFGDASTVPAPGDYDGDGRTDLAVFDTDTAVWMIYNIWTGQTATGKFGTPGAIPVPGDYNGDGTTDYAVYSPDTGYWLIGCFHKYYQTWTVVEGKLGGPTWTPVPGDYDGDGRNDLCLFEPSTGGWMLFTANGQFMQANFGGVGNIPVPGDYDGDGRTDVALYNANSGEWIIRCWAGATYQGVFGGQGQFPILKGR